MPHVKGSKQYNLKVVPHRPLHTALVRLGCASVALVASMASYHFGIHRAGQQQEELATALVQLKETKNSETQLRQQLANISVGAQVDRQSSEDVRQEIANYKHQIQQQQDQISFYRNLMAPSDGKEGLAIGDLDYTATGKTNEYHFRLKVLQLASREDAADFAGEWRYKLVGKQNGEWRSLEMKDLNPHFDLAQLKLKFKYFQSLSGEVALPPGFEPEYTELEAKAEGRGGASVNKRIKWSAQPLLANQLTN